MFLKKQNRPNLNSVMCKGSEHKFQLTFYHPVVSSPLNDNFLVCKLFCIAYLHSETEVQRAPPVVVSEVPLQSAAAPIQSAAPPQEPKENIPDLPEVDQSSQDGESPSQEGDFPNAEEEQEVESSSREEEAAEDEEEKPEDDGDWDNQQEVTPPVKEEVSEVQRVEEEEGRSLKLVLDHDRSNRLL